MKTTFYCVNVEFYDHFDENDMVTFNEVKACMTSKQAAKKPNNQYRKVYGMAAFKIWLSDEKTAVALLETVKSGKVYTDDLTAIYNDSLLQEGKAA